MKPSFKVGLVCAAIAAAIYGGYWAYSEAALANFDAPPIQPGKVTFVALNLGRDYGVRVANSTAQLVQLPPGAQKFESPQDKSEEGESRRIPIRELLESLQGNVVSLIYLTAVVNKIDLDAIQPGMVHWSEEDILAAISGDAALKSKLEQDLNVALDGTPLDEIRMTNILNGVVIDLKVPVEVSVGGEPKTLIATIPIQYRPRFAKAVGDEFNKRFNPPREFIVGNYQSHAKQVLDGTTSKEDVARSLQAIVNDNYKKGLAVQPEQLLARAHVLINDSHVMSAKSIEGKDDKGKDVITMQIELNEEGRKRLWKYSRERKGFALLVVVDGVAIAAPRITTELNERSLNLTGLREKRLVDDSIRVINELNRSN